MFPAALEAVACTRTAHLSRGSGWPAMGTAGLSRRPRDSKNRKDSLMGLGLILLIVLSCGVIALLYGAWTIRSVLSRSAGNAPMGCR